MQAKELADIQAALGAVRKEDDGVTAHYGNAAKEVMETIQGAGLFDLSHWAKIRIGGPDRKTFLHGLVTNEVKNLMASQGNYSLLLTAQGKVLTEQWVLNREEDIWLLTWPDLRQTLLMTLDKYLIMEDAVLEDQTEVWNLFSLQGPKAEEILKNTITAGDLPAQEYQHSDVTIAKTIVMAARISHTGETGFDLWVKTEPAAEVWKSLLEAGAKPAGMEGLEILRVEAGIPRVGKELDTTVIPQEAGLFHALSFSKGCYVGQEVVARLHFRGHVNRELTAFLLETDETPEGEVTLVQGEKTVGKITSAIHSPRLDRVIGLGFLRCALREPGTEVIGQWNGREIKATVTKIPAVG